MGSWLLLIVIAAMIVAAVISLFAYEKRQGSGSAIGKFFDRHVVKLEVFTCLFGVLFLAVALYRVFAGNSNDLINVYSNGFVMETNSFFDHKEFIPFSKVKKVVKKSNSLYEITLEREDGWFGFGKTISVSIRDSQLCDTICEALFNSDPERFAKVVVQPCRD